MNPIGMKIVLNFFFLSLILREGYAQVFVNDAGTREKHFIYEVKQIDEFFERFNNDSNAYIRKVYDIYHVKFKLDRSALIKSLFDYQTHDWDSLTVDHFVESVTDPRPPQRLDFYHDNWFAEATCLFQYNSSTILIPIILKIETTNRGGAKWMITAIKPNDLKREAEVNEIMVSQDKNRFITPESHANNFVELQKVFADKENFTDYLDKNFFNRTNSSAFYGAVIKSRIRFITVKEIRYYYLQIDNWIFTVAHFSREGLNSGWLIDSLTPASASEKKLYIKNLLEE